MKVFLLPKIKASERASTPKAGEAISIYRRPRVPRRFAPRNNKNQAGTSLIEVLVALAVLGLISIAILSALGTGAKATLIAREQATAESLARSQIEYVKGYPYAYAATTYPLDTTLTVPAEDGWTVLPAVVEPLHSADNGIQKITITVQRYGETLLSVTTYKADR